MFLNNKVFAAIKYSRNSVPPKCYWLLVILRLILTILPQNGYIHPDEYFQNLEIIAADTFDVEVDKTWEFNASFPVRNIFIPKILFTPTYKIIKFLQPSVNYNINSINLRTPYWLLVLPRFVFLLLSFVNDYSLYKISISYGQNFKNRMIIFASSYVTLIYACRTFSNSIEMAVSSLLILFVSKCMLITDKIIEHEEFIRNKYEKAKTPVEKVNLFKLSTHLPEHSFNHVFTIATICVIGVFNRPTFIAFALPPIFFWLYRGLGSKVITFIDFNKRIFLLVFSAIPSIFFLVIVDSGYYGYFTMAELASFKITLDNYVVTPLNFLRYNINKDNLASHGLHPSWLHFLVNVPLLFNVLGLIGLYYVATITFRFICGKYKSLPRIQSITGLMLSSFVTPLLILSLAPHQEPRFIIPVLLPLVYLFGNHMFPNESDSARWKKFKKTLLVAWYSLNILLTIFYGFIHQGGVYPLINNLYTKTRSLPSAEFHIYTSHIYSLPISLLQIDSTQKVWFDKATGSKYRLKKRHFFYEYGSMDISKLLHKVEKTVISCKKKNNCHIYLAAPCSIDLQKHFLGNFTNFKLYNEHNFFPHLSTEALPVLTQNNDLSCINLRLNIHILNRFVCFFSKFCLRLYKVSQT